jgi:hypothetical protein
MDDNVPRSLVGINGIHTRHVAEALAYDSRDEACLILS